MKINLVLLLFFVLFFVREGNASTYYWIGGATGNFATIANWNGSKGSTCCGSPASILTTDVFIVDGTDISSTAGLQTGTVTITLTTNLGFGKLVVQGNADLVLAGSSTSKTLTISNIASTDDFIINSGSSVTVSTNLNLTMGASVTMDISGALTVNASRKLITTGKCTVSGTLTCLGGINSSGTSGGELALTGTFNQNTTTGIYYGSLSGSGSLTSTTSGIREFQCGADNSSTTFSGPITNGSATTFNFVKMGTGTLTLSNTSNNWNGYTTINGTLKLGASGVIPNSSAITINGTLDLGGYSETVGSIASNGILDGASGSPILTCGGDNTSTTFSGVIKNTLDSLSIVKTGYGTLTLSGLNTYVGTTTISSGTLALSGSGTISNSGTITTASGATFDVSSMTENVAFSASQFFSVPANGSNETSTLTVGSNDGITLGSTGGITFSAYGGGATAPLTVTGASAGALALNSAPVIITTTSALTSGTYTIIAKASSATGVSGIPGTLTVNGSGLGLGLTGVLSVTSGQLLLTVCTSAVYYVSTSGVDDGSHGTSSGSGAYRTLTYALAQVPPICAVIINVAAGTYSDDNITFPAVSNITINGAGMGSTIIDGDVDVSFTDRWMTISGTVTGITITDMTIQHMDVAGNGGGVNITTTGTVTLQDIHFLDCTTTNGANRDGGAIYVSSVSTATIDRCKFTACNVQYTSSSSNGSCIYSEGVTTTIQNCLAYDNLCGYVGTVNGLVYVSAGTTYVYNCTFTENTPVYPGLLYVSAGTLTVKNTIIYNNSCTVGFYNGAGTANFTYSLNDDGTTGTITASNNITNSDVDALFIDASSDDFRISAISPARDKGTTTSTPTVDFSEATRGVGGTNTGSAYDIGCYENACTSGTYYVNDASILSDTWCSAIGSDGNSGTVGAPYLTLTKALKICGCAGNTIRVDKGTFSDDDLVISTVGSVGSQLTIQGAGMGTTIFDGDVDASSLQRFVTFNVGATYINLTDMTIQHMDVAGNGGAINITTTGNVTLQDIHFLDCTTTNGANRDGGAIYVSSVSTATIDRCKFTACNVQYTSSSSNGSCIYSEGVTTTIQNCLAYDNLCGYVGTVNGLIYVSAGTTYVYNCTFTENTPVYPGLLYVSAGTLTVKNTIIYNNSCTVGFYNGAGTANFTYSLNDDGTTGTITASNNITNSDVDALFIDASSDDFRISAISPARETGTTTGTPTVDFAEATRGAGGSSTGSAYDMGCYENACVSGTYYVNNNLTTSDTWCSAVGNDANTGTTAAPYLTLTKALKICGCAGNTIRIDKGTFSDDDLSISTVGTNGSQLTIQGSGMSTTIFDGDVDTSSLQRFITFNVGATYINLTDMTIQHMDVAGNGGAINITTTGTVTLQDIHFLDCTTTIGANRDGGAIYVSSVSTANIDRCKFTACNVQYTASSSNGSCIYSEGVTTTIQNCLAYDNLCGYVGTVNGLIYVSAGTTYVYNCTFTENTPVYPGLLYVSAGTLTVKNTIIYNNSCTVGFYNEAGTANFTYSLNDDGTTGTITASNNITNSDVDALFIDASSDDFRISAISPARDKGTTTGTPSVDFDDTDRGTGGVYAGTTYDIGCYENSCTAGIYYVNDASIIGDTWCTAIGSNSNSGSISDPYLTLDKALKACGCAGNTIRIDKGTFSDDDLVISTVGTSTSQLTIQGAGISSTIFDGDVDVSSLQRFVTFNVGATYINLTDMTIQHMDVADNGGAINITTTGNITLQDIHFLDCTTTNGANRDGGAIYVSSVSTANIDRCKFTACNVQYTSSSSNGSCIYSEGVTTTIQNCLAYDNLCGYVGTVNGLIYVSAGTTYVYNCTFTENTPVYPGLLYVSAGTLTVKNTIIYNNSCTVGFYNGAGTANFTYSLNDDGTTGTIATSNNITNSDVDALFMDASSDDFRISAISPAKDVGTSTSTPTVDFNQITRGSSGVNTGTAYDIGCYENECSAGTYYVNDASTTGDIWVSAVGSDANAGTSALPFLTLTKALKVCGCSGNSVKVDAGSYSDDDISLSASSFTIQGASMALTIFDGDVDGSSLQRFMTLNVTATSFKMSDMTIQHMDVAGNGGGVNITTTGTVTLQDIYFLDCTTTNGANRDGGAIYVSSVSTATIDRCKFTSCNVQYTSSSSNGSCIYSEGVTTTIQNCLAYDNLCGYVGTVNGLIYVSAGTTYVYNCTFTENTPVYPGLLYVSAGTLTVKNTIIYNNSCTKSFYNGAGTANFTYSLYDDAITGTITTSNNITASAPSFVNAAADNFTIGSGSAAKDVGTNAAGIPTVDFLEASRPYGAGYDIGCYEYSPVFYWVGGSGNWSAFGTHWATSSGGASFQSNAPTSSDNVIFDSNSSGTITVDATANCFNLTTTGSSGTLAGSNDINVYGNMTLGHSYVWTNTGTLTFKATSTGKDIQTNSVALTSSNITFNGVGGGWSLQDKLTTSGNITLTSGTLLATSNAISLAGNWTSSGGVFTPGTGTVTFTGNTMAINGTDASENFYNLTVNKTAGQSLSCGGSVATLAVANNYTQTTGNFSAPATMTVGTNFTLTAGTYTANSSLTVGNNMLLTAGTYNASANPVTISGNFTNNGSTFNAGTSTFTLNGTAKYITGSTSSTFYNLTISGSTTGSTSTIVQNTLNLGAKLTLNNCTLTIGTTSSNGSITGYSSSNYIVASDIGGFIGYLKRYVNSNTSYVLPIGDVDDYVPLTFTLNSNGGLSNAYITTYNGILAVSGTSTRFGSYLRRNWSLTQSGITSANYNVSLVYVDGDVFGTEANYFPIKYSGVTWYESPSSSYGFTDDGTSASVTVGTNTLAWLGLTSFSLFGGAGDKLSSLPIELLYFIAQLKEKDVELNWETATEKNSDVFIVEKTYDGEYFEIVGNIDGAGNSLSPIQYSLYDFNVANSIIYYRLKHIDFDGKYVYSDLVTIDNRIVEDTTKRVAFETNILGQEINEYYRGLVIIVYTDGSTMKVIR